jgi:hypothetical protein
LLHLGIGLTMSIGPFTLVSLVGYIAYLDRCETSDTRVGSRDHDKPLKSNPSPREHEASLTSDATPEPA